MTDELNQALSQLRASLANPESLDEQTRESLGQLVDDIGRVLNEPTSGQSDSEGLSLSERLQDWIEKREAEHPEWTNALSMIAERLADMGI